LVPREIVLKVASVRHATPLTRIVRLDLGDSSFRFKPGEAAMIGLAESPDRVPYSIASSPEEAKAENQLEFLIKIEPSGRWGHKFDRIARGQRVAVNGPFGSFIYPARPGRKQLLFIAGGTGIAPIRSMLMHAIAQGRGGRLKVLYSARTPEDFAYLSELRGLVRRGLIELRLHATRESGGDTGNWRGARGRITLADLQPLVTPGQTLGFVCGPAAMVEDVPVMLEQLGVPQGDVKLEKWSS
jgi:ferredoxin-NADP reductase